MSFNPSQLSDLRQLLDSDLRRRKMPYLDFISSVAAISGCGDPMIATMSERVSKVDDRFVFNLGIFHCSWSDTISFIGPRQLVNPLGGYFDENRHLDWVFGADYAEVASYRVICGNYDSDLHEFAVADFGDSEDAMVVVTWPTSGSWPEHISIDSEYTARHGLPKLLIRGIAPQDGSYSADYWIIPKQELGLDCLNAIEKHRQQLQEKAEHNWRNYEAGKLYFRQCMQDYVAQHPWLQPRADFIWGENAMAFTMLFCPEPAVIEYCQEGLNDLIEDLSQFQSILGGGSL